jgi:hypothetical protein
VHLGRGGGRLLRGIGLLSEDGLLRLQIYAEKDNHKCQWGVRVHRENSITIEAIFSNEN